MHNISLQIQTVLYNNNKADLIKSIGSLNKAARFGQEAGLLGQVKLCYGDSSAEPVFSKEEIENLNKQYEGGCSISYTFFNANMGSAGGQNALAKDADSDYIFIINPDIIAAYNIFSLLLEPFAKDGRVGITECRQMPIEHPKDYDRSTFETSWSSGACTFIKTSVFREVGGYDSDSFFMYCDDVDLSWRVRLAGYKTLFIPSAVVFHCKLLGNKGEWQPSDAEIYYSAHAFMLMAHKWSYPDLLNEVMVDYGNSALPLHQKALADIKKRIADGRMPQQIDPGHSIGEIINRNFGKMRFTI